LNVGVFGGTFNPVHMGHLRAAEDVRQTLGLDRLLFVPSGAPPHKAAKGVAPSTVRLEMVRLAIEGNPYFEASSIEIDRQSPSYSTDTLKELGSSFGGKARLWFLIGSDAFLEIHTWKNFDEIFELADLAVMLRPPPSPDIAPPSKLSAKFTKTENGFVHVSGKQVRLVPVSMLDISSTAIRKALLEGKSIRYLVPDSVLDFLNNSAEQHLQWFQGSKE